MITNFNVELINSILNDLWNFQLVVIGIALSIFTLLYSFAIAKREELKGIMEQIRNGDKSLLLVQKVNFIRSYIEHFKKANKHYLFILILSFSLFSVSWFVHRLVCDCFLAFKTYVAITVGGITLCLIAYCIILISILYINYVKETKI